MVRSLLVTYVCCDCMAGWWNDTGDDLCQLCGKQGEIRGETLAISLKVSVKK